MKSRWLIRISAVGCALCLAVCVMCQSVFAGAGKPDDADEAAPRETALVVFGGQGEQATPLPDVTDNRQQLPLYVGGQQAGMCTLVEGEPYISVTDFCSGLGLRAQVEDTGVGVGVSADGVALLALTGQAYFTCNERYLYLPHGVQLLNGAVALPVESLVRCLGMTACWDRIQWTLTVEDTVVTPLPQGGTYYDETDVYWLSHLIGAMAGDQPLEAQIAVGSVCVNRLHDDAFGQQDNMYEVIFAKNQFDAAANGQIYIQPDEEATLAAKLALEGFDLADGAAYVSTQDMGAGYKRVAQLGDLQFFTTA